MSAGRVAAHAQRNDWRAMKAVVNGEAREVPGGLTVARLLEHLCAPDTGVAVALNDRVLSRAAFADELLEDGDRIEIVRAVAGG